MKTLITSTLLFIATFGICQNLHTRNKDLPCLDKHYNLVVHHVYDSLRMTVRTQSIDVAIEEANKFFAPICVSFSRCFSDTVYNYNYNTLVPVSETGELSILYNDDNRINLYLISDTLLIPNISGVNSGRVGEVFSADIFLRYSGSLTHTLGLFFGLRPTYFDNGVELVNGSNCEIAGDLICDTPADPFIPGDFDHIYTDGCIFVSDKRDANGEYYQPDVGNIMSAYGFDCGFTRGQYLKMAESYLTANRLNW